MTQEQRRMDTRSSIISAAAEVFSDKGFNESGVEDICNQAGISKGAFYHHFKSKQQLMLILMDKWIEEVARQIGPIEEGQVNFLELLMSLPESMKPAFTKVKGQLNLFLELYIKGLSDPQLQSVSQRTHDKFTSFFSYVVEQGIKQGSIRKVNVEDCSKTLFSLTIGFMVQGMLDPHSTDYAKLAKESIGLLLTPS
ncbi:MAG: TetR/AcrR family transcriptional regulator [Actinomycetota bacterium]|nr:TetR/AcrR family transcriptional regulator [Actinomycetota bacterium]